ncbi:alpha/beta hydrolase [Streptomyces alboflavus]|uniref:alpha/beta hydrolase n=1 Tax=Streptomyces alboflavus TaxID=67267 RepID=UPI0004C202A5|nr:alpha/beta hydrolase [Streptomyces alboflavus]
MDLATLKALKPNEYAEAANGYRRTSDMARAAHDRVGTQIAAAMRKSLKGEAASAAIKQLAELGKNFHYVQTECGLVGSALDAFSYEMEAAKKKLDAALADAKAGGLTVHADGSVGYPPGGDKDKDGRTPEGGTATGLTDETASAVGRQAANFNPNPKARLAQDCADTIARALKEATEADAKWAPKVRALKADDDLTVSAKDWADAGSDTRGVNAAGKEYLDSMPQPPKNGDPKANAEWWKGLDADERSAWVAMRPDSVGNLDGLPSTVRDEANRMVLAEARGNAQVEYETWLKNNPAPPRYTSYINPMTGTVEERVKVSNPAWEKWDERRKNAHKPIDGMDAIQTRFDQSGVKGMPEAYLLGFSAEGDGRAIVANGNPDTADHQAVYVPGTKAALGNIEGDIERGVKVWNSATARSDGESVSTVTWLGYDAPDDVVKDATFEHYAYDGAPALNRFLDGLETTHTGDTAPHRTVIGHSYGSTLIGSAAQTGDLNSDDVVFAGSPGAKVSHADQLDVPKGHVWNEDAKGDPVPEAGRFLHGGSESIFEEPKIPSDPGFGANQMATDTEGHSGYWDEGSRSLQNQALVVVGKGEDVKLVDPPSGPSEELMRAK